MPMPPKFGVTVDAVVFTIRDGALHALMVQRKHDPYQGRWAFPGGFVDPKEDLPDAVFRELREETGLQPRRFHLEQIAGYGDPDRDPRGRTISVAFLVLTPEADEPVAADDAGDASWKRVSSLLREPKMLAFDHGHILRDGLERVRSKLEHTPAAAVFLSREFTMAELRGVYEAVWGRRLDARTFSRRALAAQDFLVAAGGGQYRAGRARILYPPLLRRSRFARIAHKPME